MRCDVPARVVTLCWSDVGRDCRSSRDSLDPHHLPLHFLHSPCGQGPGSLLTFDAVPAPAPDDMAWSSLVRGRSGVQPDTAGGTSIPATCSTALHCLCHDIQAVLSHTLPLESREYNTHFPAMYPQWSTGTFKSLIRRLLVWIPLLIIFLMPIGMLQGNKLAAIQIPSCSLASSPRCVLTAGLVGVLVLLLDCLLAVQFVSWVCPLPSTSRSL